MPYISFDDPNFESDGVDNNGNQKYDTRSSFDDTLQYNIIKNKSTTNSTPTNAYNNFTSTLGRIDYPTTGQTFIDSLNYVSSLISIESIKRLPLRLEMYSKTHDVNNAKSFGFVSNEWSSKSLLFSYDFLSRLLVDLQQQITYAPGILRNLNNTRVIKSKIAQINSNSTEDNDKIFSFPKYLSWALQTETISSNATNIILNNLDESTIISDFCV